MGSYLEKQLLREVERGDIAEAKRLLEAGAKGVVLGTEDVFAESYARRIGQTAIFNEIVALRIRKQKADDEAGRAKLRAISIGASAYLRMLPGRDEVRVIAEASYSPHPSVARRFIAFSLVESSLKRSADAWVLSDEIEPLRTMIPAAAWGASDSMFATREKFVWATVDGVLQLWRNRKRRATVSADGVAIRGAYGETRISRSDVGRVFVDVDAGWSRHRVFVVPALSRWRVLAARKNVAALLDPTYDALNLCVDADWACVLGRAVASVLRVPCELHKDLM